jgi:hypothetical protein
MSFTCLNNYNNGKEKRGYDNNIGEEKNGRDLS